MAQDDGQERTEQATPKRLQEARDKGQIARSREWNTMAILMTSAAGILLLGEGLINGLSGFMRHGLHITRAQAFDAAFLTHALQQAMGAALDLFAPLLGLLLLVTLLAPIVLGGWSFSSKGFSFDFGKLDPLKGLGRIISTHGLMELLKALAKFVLIGSVTVLWLWHTTDTLLNLSKEPLVPALAHTINALGWSFLVMSATLMAIAAIDVPLQLWQYAKQLKMTRQEIKDEHKESDGSPEVKGRLRHLQREMAQRRMMAEVPKADVIITNPTHYAVALRYDQSKMRAPKVVAKGAELIAARIREAGKAAGVSIVSAPALARAVYYSTELNREIPSALYLAVAQLLAYVYQLRQYRHQNSAEAGQPIMPDFPIPDEFQRD
ncbi:MAG TPA: flagellar biosynthesis protein FlhB [Gammaproteobacteria bacterium]|nr:flagellar biosynthesis protein FlhB [Gammaproteobacteria bacterium]